MTPRSAHCLDIDHEDDDPCLGCWFVADMPRHDEHETWMHDVRDMLRRLSLAHEPRDAIRWATEARVTRAAEVLTWLEEGFADVVLVRMFRDGLDVSDPSEASFALVLAYSRRIIEPLGGDFVRALRPLITERIVWRRGLARGRR